MKKISNFIVAIITLVTPFLSLTNLASAADKNVTINTNIDARVVFGDHIEGEDEVVGQEFMVSAPGTNGNVDENLLVYVSVEPDFFANVKLTSVLINNAAQTITAPNGRNVYTLSAADSYTIDITGTATENYNINWSNPGYTDPSTPEDVKIKNGNAKVVKVYDNATDMNDISASIPCVANGCVDENTKEGFIHFEKGNVIVFEFVPEYGYQLTSVNMNGLPLDPQTDVNQYVLDTADATGNGHFSATFTKTSDVVKTYSNVVKSGVLDLSSGAINAGTGLLSVNDFEPSADQTTKFAETASGYQIANYLDLSMQQIFYKGSDDSTNVWSNDLSQLAANADISLELAEGINGNDIAIVHEKHDGTYELIAGTYDATTNTVSFATDGFSNYAIAYRTIKAPDTGVSTSETNGISSSIITIAVITLGSVTALYVVSRKIKKEQ
ncbi:hypothetical protein IKF20_02850 [Candidatus Saccharibacteria bacterium]|nr:hypothetical protein [Candidatus Saccharibacteria bacterium]